MARAVLVDGARDQFFARSAFAGDHDSRVAVRDAPHHFEHFLHGGRLSNDAVLVLLDREAGLELLRALHFGRGFDRGIDHDLQIERQLFLAHEIEGAEAHRFDHALRRAECAGDDDQRVGIAFAQAREQFEPTVCAQPHLGDGDNRILGGEKTEGFFRSFGRDDVDVTRAELRLGPIEKIRIRIGDEDFLFRGHRNQMPP